MKKKFDGPNDNFYSLHPCQQQPQDDWTVGGVSCCGPQSLHPRLIEKNHNILCLYLPQQPKEGHEVHWPSLPRLKR